MYFTYRHFIGIVFSTMKEKPMSDDRKPVALTTANGAPVPNDDTSVTAGQRGPVVATDWRLFEKLAHFNRERIPERVVHARGTGAYGTFKLTKDLSAFTDATFLRGDGTTTEVFVRFSTVGGGQDSSDYARDPRGFAVKFYTDQGNFDLVGNNTPVFFLRDPIKFPDFVHSQKKNPRTNLPDPAAMYEFWANSPQSLHQVTILMSDRGIPASYRHMNGYSSHTLSFYQRDGQRFWVKWHFKTDQGIRTVSDAEAQQLPSHGAQADLINAIERGEFPSWTVKLQVLAESELERLSVDPFDLTKVWPHAEAPLFEVGSLTLNKNVRNYFAEVEQATFSPSNFVPGIAASPDKMLQARLLAYPDAHRYRVGTNAATIPVNAPRCPVHHYQRDGAFASGTMATSDVNFYPNDRTSIGSPAPGTVAAEPPLALPRNSTVARFDDRDADNFAQAGDLYRLMTREQKRQLVRTIAGGLRLATPSVQARMIEQFSAADPDYGDQVKTALKH